MIETTFATAPFHAHVYYRTLDERETAKKLWSHLQDIKRKENSIAFIGELKDKALGPHPVPQFEIHFTRQSLNFLKETLNRFLVTALIHPLTDSDYRDHTENALWVGKPLALNLDALDKDGENQALGRFAETHFTA